VFNDANGNGVFDSRELPMYQAIVFIDVDLTGQYVPGDDPVAVTDANGNYTIAGLTAGQYLLTEQDPTGYQIDTPFNGSVSITVTAGQTVTGENFGDQVTQFVVSGSPPPTSTPPTPTPPPSNPVNNTPEPIGPFIPPGWVSTAPLPTTPPPKKPAQIVVPIVVKPTPPKPAPNPTVVPTKKLI
jgi:hypothetical protein